MLNREGKKIDSCSSNSNIFAKKSETRFRSLRRLLYFEEKAPDKRCVFSSLHCKSSFVFSILQIIR